MKKDRERTNGKERKRWESDDNDEDMADVGDEALELSEDEDGYSPTKSRKGTKDKPAIASTKPKKAIKAT